MPVNRLNLSALRAKSLMLLGNEAIPIPSGRAQPSWGWCKDRDSSVLP